MSTKFLGYLLFNEGVTLILQRSYENIIRKLDFPSLAMQCHNDWNFEKDST